jgi:hypothetical protein
MAFNLTVEDNSPLVSYAPSGAWSDNSDSDSFVQSYSGKSLHTTFAQGATATINFNGTGIWLFGGKRSIYGTYTITVDGLTTMSGSATSADPAFDQLLGGASGLTNGPHTLVLTNTGLGTAIDLDSFVFQGQVGSGDSVSITTIDDSDSRITYGPSAADWLVDIQPGLNINDTLHFTEVPGASATIPFTGDAVAIYGTVSPDQANILVSLDGQTSTVPGGAGGLARTLHTKTLLYYADNLGSQQHQLVLSSDQSLNTGQFIDFDAITVYSSSDASDGTNNVGVPLGLPGDSSSSSRRARLLPVIIGGVVGAVVLLLLLASIFFFLHCRRQRKRKRNSSSNDTLTPSLPMQEADIMEAGLRNSNYFLEVKMSPRVLPPRPPQVLTLPFERSAVTRSYKTASVISDSILQLDFPEPPRTIPRLTPSGPMGLSAGQSRAPVRPMRPPNLVLSP